MKGKSEQKKKDNPADLPGGMTKSTYQQGPLLLTIKMCSEEFMSNSRGLVILFLCLGTFEIYLLMFLRSSGQKSQLHG